jgi:hypothetical protein
MGSSLFNEGFSASVEYLATPALLFFIILGLTQLEEAGGFWAGNARPKAPAIPVTA